MCSPLLMLLLYHEGRSIIYSAEASIFCSSFERLRIIKVKAWKKHAVATVIPAISVLMGEGSVTAVNTLKTANNMMISFMISLD